MKSRVLIVDDEEAIRSSLKMIFEYEGYEVLLAANGQAATNPPIIVLMCILASAPQEL